MAFSVFFIERMIRLFRTIFPFSVFPKSALVFSASMRAIVWMPISSSLLLSRVRKSQLMFHSCSISNIIRITIIISTRVKPGILVFFSCATVFFLIL